MLTLLAGRLLIEMRLLYLELDFINQEWRRRLRVAFTRDFTYLSWSLPSVISALPDKRSRLRFKSFPRIHLDPPRACLHVAFKICLFIRGSFGSVTLWHELEVSYLNIADFRLGGLYSILGNCVEISWMLVWMRFRKSRAGLLEAASSTRSRAALTASRAE